MLIGGPGGGKKALESTLSRLSVADLDSDPPNVGAVGDSRWTSEEFEAMVAAALDDVLGGGTIGESGDRGDLGPGKEKFSTDRVYRVFFLAPSGDGDPRRMNSIDLVGLNGGGVVGSIVSGVDESRCKASEEKFLKWRFSALIPRSSRRGA